jgi:hypothetical protein
LGEAFRVKEKELKKQAQKKRDKGTPAYERENEADESKITNAIKMFKRAISLGFVIDYVLIDSWFTCEALICFGCKEMCGSPDRDVQNCEDKIFVSRQEAHLQPNPQHAGKTKTLPKTETLLSGSLQWETYQIVFQ